MKISTVHQKMGRVLGYAIKTAWNKIAQPWNIASINWENWN